MLVEQKANALQSVSENIVAVTIMLQYCNQVS